MTSPLQGQRVTNFDLTPDVPVFLIEPVTVTGWVTSQLHHHYKVKELQPLTLIPLMYSSSYSNSHKPVAMVTGLVNSQ